MSSKDCGSILAKCDSGKGKLLRGAYDQFATQSKVLYSAAAEVRTRQPSIGFGSRTL